MRPKHVFSHRKCDYRPWLKCYHKWRRTIYGWPSCFPWEKRKVDQSFWVNLENVCAANLFAKKLRRLSTPAEYIRKFIEACVIHIILYCSPAIFPGLPKQDFALLRRSIKLISNVCGLSFSYLTNFACERHIKASSDFAARILADSELQAYGSYLPAISWVRCAKDAPIQWKASPILKGTTPQNVPT